MRGDVKVEIDYDKIKEDERWDGLKGYLTNTTITPDKVYAAYHNLWHVERAFRITKSKIEIRPMFHFTRRRIEAHVCICFVALYALMKSGDMDDIVNAIDKIHNNIAKLKA
jgi:transposase